MRYAVKEIFYTLQGEGANTGRPAVFLRFAGCNLWSGYEKDRATAVCRFCDTEFVGTDGPGGGNFASATELAEAVLLAQQGIDLPGPVVQELWPVELGEAVGQALGGGGVVELRERIVLLHEAQLLPHHLLGQVLVAIDIDLDRERQPGLQAHVDQAEVGIEEVVIEDPLLPGRTDELRPPRAGHQLVGGTGFLGAEDADQTCADPLVANELVGPRVFAERAAAVQIGAPRFSRPAPGMLDQPVGVLGREALDEVAAPDLEDAIDQVFEIARHGQTRMALEDDPVLTPFLLMVAMKYRKPGATSSVPRQPIARLPAS